MYMWAYMLAVTLANLHVRILQIQVTTVSLAIHLDFGYLSRFGDIVN